MVSSFPCIQMRHMPVFICKVNPSLQIMPQSPPHAPPPTDTPATCFFACVPFAQHFSFLTRLPSATVMHRSTPWKILSPDSGSSPHSFCSPGILHSNALSLSVFLTLLPHLNPTIPRHGGVTSIPPAPALLWTPAPASSGCLTLCRGALDTT